VSVDEQSMATPPADKADKTEGEGTNWVEIIAAALLGLAGILTAYAAYQGSQAGDKALEAFTESSRITSQAEGFYNEASQTFNGDQAVFLQYQLLVEEGKNDLAAVVRDNLFSEELEKATAAWEDLPDSDDGPRTPLETDDYVIEAADQGEELTKAADQKFEDAQKADNTGDNYDLATVYFAVALFFAGIAALFRVRGVQIAMLAGAVLLLVPGLRYIGAGEGWF
jgi:hypothetical protein